VASAFSLALLALGAGLGLVSVSPWSSSNVSATTFGVLMAAWLFACGIGGYLAGRLRTRWVNIHTDETYFRDTAHGLLVWGLGAAVSASLLASTVSSVITGTAQAGAAALQSVGTLAAGAMPQVANQVSASAGGSNAFFIDTLFRTDHPDAGDQANSSAETGRIFLRGLGAGELPSADKRYVAQLVAARTGLSQADAEKRVSDTFDQARAAEAQAADKAKAAADVARKTGVYVALWAVISLPIGAFSASYMATVGGSAHRDLPANLLRAENASRFRAVPRSG
jgi:hypothetical protein